MFNLEFLKHLFLFTALNLLVNGLFCQDLLERSHQAPEIKSLQGADLLLSRLDLDAIPLLSDKNLAIDSDLVGKLLFTYFKQRINVRHPVLDEAPNTVLADKDLRIADDALKHIFVGQPAYPSHFCGADIDWSSSPVTDKEWVWQLNRMYFWNAMARVYRQTGEEKYAQAWCQQLVDWTLKNPNDDSHKYAWRSIEAGIRGHAWMELFHSFIKSPAFTEEVLVAFLNSCFDHATYLMTQYRSGSNWGLMEAEGMAFISITFPEFHDAEKWRAEAFRRLNNEINLQVYADGHQRELAIGYHLGCINWFYRTYELAKLNKLENAFPETYLESIEKMCEVPMKIGLPDGTNAQFGDAWAGKPAQHRDRYLSWSTRFGRNDFLYLATNGKEGVPPDSTSYALKESGYYSMRSGWNRDAICMVLKCGPDGGGHCQPDNGTFELFAGGRNLMPDGGSYIYSGDPENRAWFRQTKVHQTLTLNGKDTNYAPKLVKWSKSDSLDILVVENAGYDGLTHRRTVFFVDKRYFVIVDDAFGDATGDVDLHFQFAPGEAIFDDNNLSADSGFETGWNVWVQSMTQEGVSMEQEEGQVSFLYTKKEPRPAFMYRLKKDLEIGVRFITLVVPYFNSQPTVFVRTPEDLEPGSSRLAIEVSELAETRILSYEVRE